MAVAEPGSVGPVSVGPWSVGPGSVGPGSLRTSLSLGSLGGVPYDTTDRHGGASLCGEPSCGSVCSTFSTMDEGYEQIDTGGSENLHRRHSDVGGGDGVTSLDWQRVGDDGGDGGGGGDTEMRPETPPATPETAGRDIRMHHAGHVIHPFQTLSQMITYNVASTCTHHLVSQS